MTNVIELIKNSQNYEIQKLYKIIKMQGNQIYSLENENRKQLAALERTKNQIFLLEEKQKSEIESLKSHFSSTIKELMNKIQTRANQMSSINQKFSEIENNKYESKEQFSLVQMKSRCGIPNNNLFIKRHAIATQITKQIIIQYSKLLSQMQGSSNESIPLLKNEDLDEPKKAIKCFRT